MQQCLIDAADGPCTPVIPVDAVGLADWLRGPGARFARWVEEAGFRPDAGAVCLLPGPDLALAGVLAGVPDRGDPFALAALPRALPPGDYRIDADWDRGELARASLGWALGAYRFDRYRSDGAPAARLALAPGVDAVRLRGEVEAIGLVRDLVNTPAEDMMPEHLAATARTLAFRHGARFGETVGDDLLAQTFPAVHAVGRASAHAPRMIDLEWGEADAPAVVLAGKGVCFDSGGLDLKNASGMRLMKKDMGGAAHALGLASMLMSEDLPVRLRVLIPAVENAVSGNALRPGDVIDSRAGLRIEIDNTDAEGRVVLADALAESGRDGPATVIDFATLTGAARVALGTELPALFCNDDRLAGDLVEAAGTVRDPLWRMPLHEPYRGQIDSTVADIANGSAGRYGGAITAALFLKAFVPEGCTWAHLDIMAWNLRARAGRPEGGEAMGLRACAEALRRRHGG